MARWTPDPSFYPSPQLAMEAPPEELAYITMLAVGENGQTDGIGVVDTNPESSTYGQLVGRTDFPHSGNELHHFGWNACSSHLCPYAPHAHVERRYLIVPGTHSNRIHILDTQPDPRRPKLVKVIEPETVVARTGYTAPHTVHCGPDGVYINALGAPDGNGPGGIFVMDHETFEVKGPWERDRGDQYLAYDFWWHLGHDTMITSEWGTPNMVINGVDPELLLAGKYGHALHVWDLRSRRHQQTLDLGAEQQMVLELRPAHNPQQAYGFVGVVLSLEDLSASIFLWYREGHNGRAEWKTKKVITIPAEPADRRRAKPLELVGVPVGVLLLPVHVVGVADDHQVRVRLPEPREHVHAFGRDDLESVRNVQRVHRSDRDDLVALDEDDAVGHRAAAVAVDQATADQRGLLRENGGGGENEEQCEQGVAHEGVP